MDLTQDEYNCGTCDNRCPDSDIYDMDGICYESECLMLSDLECVDRSTTCEELCVGQGFSGCIEWARYGSTTYTGGVIEALTDSAECPDYYATEDYISRQIYTCDTDLRRGREGRLCLLLLRTLRLKLPREWVPVGARLCVMRFPSWASMM